MPWVWCSWLLVSRRCLESLDIDLHLGHVLDEHGDMLAVTTAGLMTRHDADHRLQLANMLAMRLHDLLELGVLLAHRGRVVLLDVLHALREAEHLIAEAECR